MDNGTALELILAQLKRSDEKADKVEQHIQRLSDCVHRLANSSVRYEEKVAGLEERTQKEFQRTGQQIDQISKKLDNLNTHLLLLDKDVRDLKSAKEKGDDRKEWALREILPKLAWHLITILFTAGALLALLK
jgi:DNA repair exonuclease SbcCD ATPase subunit